MLGRTSGGIALRQRVGRRCKPAVGCRALGPRSSSAARRGILQGSSPGLDAQRGPQVMRFPLPKSAGSARSVRL